MRYHNNPANIRYSEFNKWQGLVGDDNGFCVFESIDYGVRALILVLRKYICVYKKKSVKEIISRFAPASENNTRCYVAYVEHVLGKHGCNTVNIEYLSDGFMWLCIAICWYESHTSLTFDRFLAVKYKFDLIN